MNENNESSCKNARKPFEQHKIKIVSGLFIFIETRLTEILLKDHVTSGHNVRGKTYLYEFSVLYIKGINVFKRTNYEITSKRASARGPTWYSMSLCFVVTLP